jgi:hypothetical protein
VPKITSYCKNDNIEEALCEFFAYSFRLEDGNGYMLHTDMEMHRVTPIADGEHGMVINMVWPIPPVIGKGVSYDMIEALFS